MPKPDCSQKTAKEYHLLLFVAGNETNSRLARDYIVKICRKELYGRCTIDIVDVFEDFPAAVRYNILITPTLKAARIHSLLLLLQNLPR